MRKIGKKLILILALVLVVSPLLFVSQGQTKIQPYYSGDAVYYDGQLVVATADSGYLEIFALQNKQLVSLVKVKVYNGAYNTYQDYSNVKLDVDGGHLYAYAVAGFTAYKYDFSDLSHLLLAAKVTNTYWNWYSRVDRYGDNIGLVGKKGVDLVDANLQIIVSFPFTPSENYSLRGSGSNQYLFGVSDSKIQVYDRNQRAIVAQIPLNFDTAEANHKVYYDSISNSIFAIDDYYMKKFSLSGQLLASFRHLDAAGYDAESAAGDPNVYFSNGLGVVELSKANLKLKNYAFTTTLGGPQGWAMGLKLVNTDSGDMLVVFNASNILVLDSNLHKVASIDATASAASQSNESLYLNYDHNSATRGATINLSGGGYYPGEKLAITFGTASAAAPAVYVVADNHGRFATALVVPNLAPQRLDIKVTGLDSGLHYSLSFEIR